MQIPASRIILKEGKKVDNERILRVLTNHKINDEDALGMIFSNFIDIGGTFMGLTVENAIEAGRLLRKYDKMKKND